MSPDSPDGAHAPSHVYPWKTLASTTLADDEWLRITAERCEVAPGVAIEPYYVLRERDWVHVLALNAAGEIVTVRQWRHAAAFACLELPGGIVDQGEDPLAAAQRELLEETGCRATRWTAAGWLWANPARQNNRVHLFVAEGAEQVAGQQLDLAEEIVCAWLSPAALEAAIARGDFGQALHVASYYRGLAALGRLTRTG